MASGMECGRHLSEGLPAPRLCMRRRKSASASGCMEIPPPPATKFPTSKKFRSRTSVSDGVRLAWLPFSGGVLAQMPDRSGFPSRVLGAGADRFALPSLRRGVPGAGYLIHWAIAVPASPGINSRTQVVSREGFPGNMANLSHYHRKFAKGLYRFV